MKLFNNSTVKLILGISFLMTACSKEDVLLETMIDSNFNLT